jgi:hypothetical protein
VNIFARTLESLIPKCFPVKTKVCDDVLKNENVLISMTAAADEKLRQQFSVLEVKVSSATIVNPAFPICGALHITVESEVQMDVMHAVSSNFKANDLSIILED